MWADDLGARAEAAWLTPGVPDTHKAAAWLATRGVPQDTRSFGIGIGCELPADTPDHFRQWAERVDFANAAVIVCRNWYGMVSAFQARNVDDKLYLTYEVSPGGLVWGADVALDHVWRTQHLVLAEGPFDALACRLAGAQGVIATLGALPGKNLVRWVGRLAKRITVLYDTDQAGREGVKRLGSDLPNCIVSAPAYHAHDPWDLWITRPHVLRALVQS